MVMERRQAKKTLLGVLIAITFQNRMALEK